MPGWRSSGFSPLPSGGTSVMAPAGRNIATACWPSDVTHSLANGFSNSTVRLRKKASVTRVTAITHGRNSRSRSQRRAEAAVANPAISHDQNSSDPACPPHQAVIFR